MNPKTHGLRSPGRERSRRRVMLQRSATSPETNAKISRFETRDYWRETPQTDVHIASASTWQSSRWFERESVDLPAGGSSRCWRSRVARGRKAVEQKHAALDLRIVARRRLESSLNARDGCETPAAQQFGSAELHHHRQSLRAGNSRTARSSAEKHRA